MFLVIGFTAGRGGRVETAGLEAATNGHISGFVRNNVVREGKLRRDVGEVFARAVGSPGAKKWVGISEECPQVRILIFIVAAQAEAQVELFPRRERGLGVGADADIVQGRERRML